MLTPGSIVGGRFRIERILGEGGMGQVAVAMHLELEQRFALKVLHDRGATDPANLERFAREARSAARLRSEHVCRVFDVGRLDDGAPFIVMELLEGIDLAALAARGPLPVATAVDHVLQACVAVAEAHHAGIIHRDLKPANLFLTRGIDGSPLIKVLDFGIAKAPAAVAADLTRTATLMGSPGYMSPEQLRSPRDVDARSDLWSLGVILYQLVAGHVPFPAETLTELAVKIAMDPPLPANFDPAFAAIVLRCLEKAPRDRYASVAELAIALGPFGGPRALAIAESIQRLARPPTDALAATMAPIDAPTAASLASSRRTHPTTLQSATGVSTTPPPPRGRTSWTAIALGGFAAVVAVVAIGAATRRPPRVIDLRGSSPTGSSTSAIAIPLSIEVEDGVDGGTPTATVVTPDIPVEPAPLTTHTQPRRSASVPPAKAAPKAAPPADELERSFEAALAEGRCDVAADLMPKLVKRSGDRDYKPRVRTCLDHAPKDTRVGWYLAEAQDRITNDLTGALALAETALAEDPHNATAARMAVYIACHKGDAAKAQKYVPALSEEGRRDLERVYYCQQLKIKFD